MIYREKRGNKDVKEYKVPYNPKTEEQGKQRDYLKNAVLAWKTNGYSGLDIKAWNIYASIQKKNLSGYNIFLRERINTDKESKTWAKLTNCNIYDVYGEQFKVDINVESDLSGKLYIETSKYSMLKEFTGVFSVNKYTFTVTGLSKNTKYYFYIKNTSPGEMGRTGIYSKKTTDLVPVIINVGNLPIDRESAVGVATLVDKCNPASGTGKITKVELFTSVAMTGCKVAIFFIVSGNNLSTRDYEVIGNVAIGYNSFTVDLEVQIGEFIGLSFDTGSIKRDAGASPGMYYIIGEDHIPCTDKTFEAATNYKLSIYGTGQE